MTAQEKIILIGVAGFAVSKLYFHKPLMFSVLVGLSTITAWTVITATNES